ncbi:MAG: hypothetical protein JNK16_06745 [Phycisphaerales bacterium]|nr:hypothetical protein [Phycisphaerales bacterium]
MTPPLERTHGRALYLDTGLKARWVNDPIRESGMQGVGAKLRGREAFTAEGASDNGGVLASGISPVRE